MTNININELEKFKLNYEVDINNSLDYLRIINQELSNMHEYINTPNIGHKVEEFNNEYNLLVKDINELSKLLSDYLSTIIKIYQSSNEIQRRGVGNEEL